MHPASPRVSYRNIVGLSLFALGLLLTGLHYQAGEEVSLPERLLLGAMHPLAQGLSRLFQGLSQPWRMFMEFRRLQGENHRLRAEVEQLRYQNQQLLEGLAELERLRALLRLKPPEVPRPLAARVIAYPWVPGGQQTVVVDAGRREGVRRGAIALGQGGVVGWVVKVGDFSSVLLLLTDRSCSIGAMVQAERGRQPFGICQGTGQGMLTLAYLTPQADVRPGDLVVTSGLGSIFRLKGLPIGRVVSVRHEEHTAGLEAMVQPFVDVHRLEEVLLLLPPAEVEGRSP